MSVWQESAACSAPWVDPAWFTDQPARAIEVCRGCPVRALCAAWADENGECGAVWGGIWRGDESEPDVPRPPVVPPQRVPVSEDGHRGSRWRWMSRRCACEACHEAAKAYDAAYKRQLRAG